jgi:hypothetical protein
MQNITGGNKMLVFVLGNWLRLRLKLGVAAQQGEMR